MASWEVSFSPQIDPEDREILKTLVEIETYNRFIFRIPLPPGIQNRIDRLNIIRAIRGTTGIEGNTLTEEEVDKVISNEEKGRGKVAKSLEEQEVINAWNVLELIKSHLQENLSGIITEELIKKIHFEVTKDCNYPHNILGKYRNHGAIAGEYKTPNHIEIPKLMREFVFFINGSKFMSQPIIRAILAHFYLVSIHPFGDGNGRTSRGIEAYILYHGKYNVRGFYSLANFYYRHRQKYINQLQDARFKYRGNLMNFVKFSLRGFAEELNLIQEEILSFIREMMFLNYVEELYLKKEINWRIREFSRYLVKIKDGLSIKEIKRRTDTFVSNIYRDKTDKTLKRDIFKMGKLELIKIDGNVIKANTEIMDYFTAGTRK
jgi:Fic family protein